LMPIIAQYSKYWIVLLAAHFKLLLKWLIVLLILIFKTLRVLSELLWPTRVVKKLFKINLIK
jgi:hypothetical protein